MVLTKRHGKYHTASGVLLRLDHFLHGAVGGRFQFVIQQSAGIQQRAFYRDEWNRAHGPGKAKPPEGEKRTAADAPAEVDGGESAVATAGPATEETGEEPATATA